MGRYRIDLVDTEQPTPTRLTWAHLLYFGLALLLVGLVTGYLLNLRPPAPLTAADAARILAEQQGWAGFTEVVEKGDKSTVQHEVFCRNCGVAVGQIRVDFNEQTAPAVGSRSALWRSLSESAAPAVAAAH